MSRPGIKRLMKTHNKILIYTVIGLILCLVIFLLFSRNKIHPVKNFRPATSGNQSVQKEILTYKGIDSVLNTFEKIPFEKLNDEYVNFSGYKKELYKENIKGKIFYKVVGGDALKILVGKFTVNDFLPDDSSRIRNMNSVKSNYLQYICIDKNVLHRLLDLIVALDEKGYDKYAFRIKDGFRYPNFNNRTGGAKSSQHIYGKAIDLSIGDINKDGKFNEATDKKIVLLLLENDIIKNTGGVGHYPGTNAVHFDTRGYKARW
jgi:uncharacterized protein YcbK (DUF882 family)